MRNVPVKLHLFGSILLRCVGFVLFLATTCTTLGQDYTRYYQLINSAEEQFVVNRDSSCYVAYDQAFNEFQPFLKDPYIASQIALSLQDTLKFLHYLEICFANGMPLNSVKASRIVSEALNSDLAGRVEASYASTYRPPRVDSDVQDELCLMCYQSDSLKTYMIENDSLVPLFEESEDRTRAYVLEHFLQNGMFPNQRVIGITTDEGQAAFFRKFNRPDVYELLTGRPGYHQEEFSLRAKCPYNIILHSRCFFREHRDLFMTAMTNGYLHPMDFGIMEETSIIWHHSRSELRGSCGPPEVKVCYNIFGYSPLNPAYNIYTDTKEGIAQVEANRAAIQMQKFSVDQKKKQMESEFGFKFFFDFKN